MAPATAMKYFEREMLTEEALKTLQEARQREDLCLDTPTEIVDWMNRRWRTDESAHKRLIDKLMPMPHTLFGGLVSNVASRRYNLRIVTDIAIVGPRTLVTAGA